MHSLLLDSAVASFYLSRIIGTLLAPAARPSHSHTTLCRNTLSARHTDCTVFLDSVFLVMYDVPALLWCLLQVQPGLLEGQESAQRLLLQCPSYLMPAINAQLLPILQRIQASRDGK